MITIMINIMLVVGSTNTTDPEVFGNNDIIEVTQDKTRYELDKKKEEFYKNLNY